MKQRYALAGALAASLVLAACGSDPAPSPAEPPPPVTNEVPTDASASATSFVGWMNQQPQSDTKEPLKVEGFTAPTSETDEPVPLR